MGHDSGREISIYCGSANPDLAQAVVNVLGLPLGRRLLRRMPDGEVHVQIEESIRGHDIYIIQSTSPPVNEHLVELLVMIDAFRRASAGRITAIMPYYGYSRQEKKSTGREPITARLVADLLETAGVDRVVSIDLHAPAIQGFFRIWMDHLTALPILIEGLRGEVRPNSVVVAPDSGRVKLAEKYARALNLPLVVMHKQRQSAEATAVRSIIGEVRDRAPILVDDIIATGGTIHASVRALVAAGAEPRVVVAATHPLLVEKALAYLGDPSIGAVFVSDTIPVPMKKRLPKLSTLSVADLLAETIRRLNRDESISALFMARAVAQPV